MHKPDWKLVAFGVGIVVLAAKVGFWPAVAIGLIAWSVKS